MINTNGLNSTTITILHVLTEATVYLKSFGWTRFGDSKYFFQRDKKLTWQESSNFCRTHGGNLAKFESIEEQEFINTVIQTQPGEYWIDGIEDTPRGIYKWASNGEQIKHNFWFPGEPNHETAKENCIETTHFYNTMWNDEECNYQQYCICQRPYYL